MYAPGRKGNQNRSLEMIRRSQSRRLNLRLLGLFPIVASRDKRAGVIEQKKGRIGQGSRERQRKPVTAPHSFNKPDGASSSQLSQTQSWREADDPKLCSQTARDQMFVLRLNFETKPNRLLRFCAVG